jgi:hypothetical protein
MKAVFTPSKSPLRGTRKAGRLQSGVSPLRGNRSSIHSSPLSKSPLKQLQTRVRPITATLGKCPYHPEKQGTFEVEGEDSFFCEKCAIQLVSQGLSVRNIENPSREAEVQALLLDIRTTKARLVDRQTAKDQDRVNKYFETVFRVLERQRKDLLERCLPVDLEDHLEKLEDMEKDIMDSLDIIIHEVQEDQYRPIYKNYRSKCQEIATAGRSRLVIGTTALKADIRLEEDDNKENTLTNCSRSRLSGFEPIKNPIAGSISYPD